MQVVTESEPELVTRQPDCSNSITSVKMAVDPKCSRQQQVKVTGRPHGTRPLRRQQGQRWGIPATQMQIQQSMTLPQTAHEDKRPWICRQCDQAAVLDGGLQHAIVERDVAISHTDLGGAR